MSKKKYNLFKALSWYTIGSILIKSINFLSLRLFTDLIDTSAYGKFGVYQSYLTIFEMIILIGTAHSIKMVKYDEKIDYESYVSSVIFIPIFGTFFFLFLAQIGFCFTDKIADLPLSMWSALFVTAGASAFINIVNSKLILEGKYQPYIISSLLNTVINISVSLFLCYLVYNAKDAYWARIVGGLLAGVGNCFFLLFFIKLRKPRIDYLKKGIIFGLPLLIHSIATQVLVQSDKIIISQLASYSAVGIYTVATNIVVIPMTLLSSVEYSWAPWYYESLSRNDYNSIKFKNTIIIVLFALGTIGFVLVCPEMVRLMTNIDYWNSIYVLIPLTINTFIELIYLIPLNLELYYKKNNAIWMYTVPVVIFNIVFDIIFIKIFGYLAGAYVTCVSRFLLFVMHYFRAKKINKNDIMDVPTICMLMIGMVIANLVTVIFLDFWIIRWGLVMLLCLVAGVFYLKNKNSYGGNGNAELGDL